LASPTTSPHPVQVAAIITHRSIQSQVQLKRDTFCELDSHADTCSFGPDAYIVRHTDQTISVSGFIDSLGTVKDVPIVTAAVAYDDPITLQTFILFFHQSLYFDKLNKHLLCPSQLRANQITVNDIPLLHLPYDQRTTQAHSIITEPPHPDLHIPLSLRGTTSCFRVRKPTFHEINSEYNCTHIHMTSDQPWDPHDHTNGQHEESIRESLGHPPSERGHTLDAVVTDSSPIIEIV
jgi:hypothetical protein